MKNYIFLADGFEEIEGLMVVDLLRRGEIPITTVSISDSLEVVGAHNISIKADQLYSEIDYSDADMLILPGGMPGTRHLLEHAELRKVLMNHNEDNKMLAAICAAPSVLGENGILSGKKATCYPGFEEKLCGAIYSPDRVVKDQNVITSKGLGTALEFAIEIIEHYKGKELGDHIKNTVQY